MPYMMVANGSGFDVHKADADGKPMGKAMNQTPMTKAAATRMMDALYANDKNATKALTPFELVELEKKCGDMEMSTPNKLSPDDPRAAYDPMGGRTGASACANCKWFDAEEASCYLVGGPIVATGLSKLWLSNETPVSADTPAPIPVTIVEPPEGMDMGEMSKKSLIDRFAEFLGIKSEETPAADEGFKVLPDGRWRAWWTNNAKDLVKENFSAKAIDAYIARVDSGKVPYPELWYKHLPIRMGKADSLARIGYLTFATGTFYDTPIGQRGKAYYEAEQKAGHSKTNSHGFLYPTNLKSNGVYHAFNTFEITVLDPGEEANPYTTFEVKTMFAKVREDQKKFDELVKIFGKDEVEKLINFGETKSLELEQAGVDLKSFSSFEGVEVEDKTAHAAVKELADATMAGLKVIADRLDAITKSIETSQTEANAKIEASAKAVADLKAYVESEFGYTPRASKAAETKLASDNTQVLHLQKANAEAGTKTSDKVDPVPVSGNKSILDYALEAAKGGSQ